MCEFPPRANILPGRDKATNMFSNNNGWILKAEFDFYSPFIYEKNQYESGMWILHCLCEATSSRCWRNAKLSSNILCSARTLCTHLRNHYKASLSELCNVGDTISSEHRNQSKARIWDQHIKDSDWPRVKVVGTRVACELCNVCEATSSEQRNPFLL